jgi:hypothetical protein
VGSGHTGHCTSLSGMAEPEIRVVMPDELPGVLELYRQLNPDDPALDLATAEPVWLLTSGFTTVFVAGIGRVLVSSCTLALVPNLGCTALRRDRECRDGCRPSPQRTGRAVLQAALDKALMAHCYKVHLASGSKRESTLRFYEGVGFKRHAKTYFEIRRASRLWVEEVGSSSTSKGEFLDKAQRPLLAWGRQELRISIGIRPGSASQRSAAGGAPARQLRSSSWRRKGSSCLDCWSW